MSTLGNRQQHRCERRMDHRARVSQHYPSSIEQRGTQRTIPDQKNGILHGATITVNNLFGSSIGNISGYLTPAVNRAAEKPSGRFDKHQSLHRQADCQSRGFDQIFGWRHQLQCREYNNHGPGLRKQNLRHQQRSRSAPLYRHREYLEVHEQLRRRR